MPKKACRTANSTMLSIRYDCNTSAPKPSAPKPYTPKPSAPSHNFRQMYTRSKIINKNVFMNSGLIEDDYCYSPHHIETLSELSMPETSYFTERRQVISATFSYLSTSSYTSYTPSPVNDCVHKLCFNVTLAESVSSSGYLSKSEFRTSSTISQNTVIMNNIQTLDLSPNTVVSLDLSPNFLPVLPIMPRLPNPVKKKMLLAHIKNVYIPARPTHTGAKPSPPINEVATPSLFKSNRLSSGKKRRAVAWL